jgi:hypothetical protein
MLLVAIPAPGVDSSCAVGVSDVDRSSARGEGSGCGSGGPRSPYLVRRIEWAESMAAESGAAAWLGDPDHRVRAAAFGILARRELSEAPGDSERLALLVDAFVGESDRVTRDGMAESLASLGPGALDVLAMRQAEAENRGEDVEAVLRARSRVLRELVVARLRETLERITGPTGEIKGFYREPFRGVAELGREAGPHLVAIAGNPAFEDTFRALAVRATGDLEVEGAKGELRRLHDLLEGRAVRKMERELGGDRSDDWDDHLFRATLYSLYRLGEPRPFDEWQRRLRGWREDPRADFIDDVDLQFRLAYNYQQVKNYRRSRFEYLWLLDEVEAYGLPWMVETVSYNLACLGALDGNREAALSYLEKAVEWGFRDREWLLRDADLDDLRDDPGFERILERLR